MNPYTRAVCRAFVAEWGAEAAGIVAEWLEAFSRRQAERHFARRLQRDYSKLFEPTDQPESALADALIREGLRRVQWRQVARALIGRFVPTPRVSVWAGRMPFSVN